MKFIIYDWAGNVVNLKGKTFKTFDDAWGYILGELTDLIGLNEDDYQEYDVKEV